MGYYCTVPQCTSLAGKTKNVKFHRFPRDENMAVKWNLILKRGKPFTKYSKVCSLHFTPADYNVTTMGQWKTLSKEAVPSMNLPKLNPDGTVMVIRKSRTVKCKESRKEDIIGHKPEKWSPIQVQTTAPVVATEDRHRIVSSETNLGPDPSLPYRLQTLNAIANNISPQLPQIPAIKPRKQDAFMQTDPVQSEEEDTQPNNSYSEPSEKSFNSDQIEYPVCKDQQNFEKKYEKFAKDYTKPSEDYIPQTNEEYNKEAEKYALERKSHYDKPIEYQKVENGYQKMDVYGTFDKEYQNREFGYQNGYQDSAEMLRNQQHNLQILQEQHRITENQNFFNETNIKQEIDFNNEEDKFSYERSKEQSAGTNPDYEGQRRLEQQQRLLEHMQQQVKQEPDVTSGCETAMQPPVNPYYAASGHNNVSVSGGYFASVSRPGAEMLIAKQNALAAQTQLWQNTTKRPFFYTESHYNTPPLAIHRYELQDIPRILQ